MTRRPLTNAAHLLSNPLALTDSTRFLLSLGVLASKSGIELKKFYKILLVELGENSVGWIREIYQSTSTNIKEPKNLEKTIATINARD